MSQLLNRRKSSFKGMIKPLPAIKDPKKDSSVEFRWSTTAVQYGFNGNSFAFSVDLDSSSGASTARNSTTSPILFPQDKFPVHLPPIQTNKKGKTNNGNSSLVFLPITLSYSQLCHPPMSMKTRHFGRNNQFLPPLSPRNEEKYIRLPSSQLRRLHVSNKYMREAKKMYFNAVSRVFVPRRSFIEIA